jgi:hypothetical protein
MKLPALILSIALLALGPAAAQQAAQPPPPTPEAFVAQTGLFKVDSMEFTLAPKEGMEYKYRLEKGAGLLFSWTATAPVHYELHSEPDGGPKGYAETFDKQDSRDSAHGNYVAPFPGIHGWYWENTTNRPVTVTLQTAGFYNLAHEFRSDGVKNKTFD